MPAEELFTADFKPSPYWWDASPLERSDDSSLPPGTDVLVIGAGYTGLHAAIQTARAGLATTIVDAQRAGWGCSTRSGGQISTSIKPSLAALTRRYGEQTARAILKEGQASLDHVAEFVREEKLDCDFAVVGRYHAAHSAKHYEKLARECESRPAGFETGAWMVPQVEQREELGTDAYCGGMVLPRHASLDPAKYHAGLLRIARNAGVRIVGDCAARSFTRDATGGFRAETEKGAVRCEKLVIATNGYTGDLTPWHRRRVIPIGSYVIATEEIPSATMDELFPTNRIVSDTRRLVYYYRPSPDRRRILFGGRVSLAETDPKKSAPKLHAELVRLFPALGGVRISHSWAGFVAYTFDTLPHCGHDKGLFYAMGYCGSGVGMAGYLGSRVGKAVAGEARDTGPFSEIPFPARPLYSGLPWFLAPSVGVYRVMDRFGL